MVEGPFEDELPYRPDDFARDTGADAVTMQRLSVYAAMLVEWNAHTNLVSPSTIPDLWRRHMFDSAQCLPLIPAETTTITDIGSGAGFPGMVLAIMLAHRTQIHVRLIDGTQKKCRFLQEVARETGTHVEIRWGRAEAMDLLPAEIVTARAVAPLEDLLPLIERHSMSTTKALLFKGARVREELTRVHRTWDFHADLVPSRSDSSGVILCVTGLRRWPSPVKRP